MKILIIGASAAGMKAACRVRRLLPHAEVTVLETTDYISWAGCGLPYYLSGDVQDFSSLTVTPYGVQKTPEFFSAAKGVKVLCRRRAENLNPEKRLVTARDLSTNESITFPYDELVIATGAVPVKPPIEGLQLPGVSCFTRPEEAMALRKAAEQGKISRVAIVGGGFIGCELCESLRALWGIEVTLFEEQSQVLSGVIGRSLARVVEAELKRQGIDLRLSHRLEKIESSGDALRVIAGSKVFEGFDRILLNLGVRPQVEPAAAAGALIGETGGLQVDTCLHTSLPHVFAVGDCVQTMHALTGKPCLMPLSSLASRMGRIAANIIAGQDDSLGPVLGTTCLKIFDLAVAAVGLTVRQAVKAGFKANAVWGCFQDKAHFYPEARDLWATLIYDTASARILGVQAVGSNQSVALVNTASIMLGQKITLHQIRDFEPAYAPPFAVALDPIHALAYTALAEREEGIYSFPPQDLTRYIEDSLVLDVRETTEQKDRPFPVSCARLLSIPFTQLRSRISEIPVKGKVIVVCARGPRSIEAVRILRERGLTAIFMGGGLAFEV
jgi:NADPH-dependent 2,4-dienoyl-CoA reductase/sulfur reductase-like enzyme/rhodanese-related sulfurtransferase